MAFSRYNSSMPAPAKFRVLFVCIGNSCRSPMAESIAFRDASDIIEASSAGLYPLGYVVEDTQKTLLANGYSTEMLSSKPLVLKAIEGADLLINLAGEPLARSVTALFGLDSGRWNGPRIETWDITDPYGADPATYQRILEEIESRVRALAERLRADRVPAET
jgi:protein-tyrosine-phosphatase